MTGTALSLLLKNLLFTIVIPGTVAVYVPLWIVNRGGHSVGSNFGMRQYAALVCLMLGAAIYTWCVWDFATFGRGTPAPIDAPRRLVVRGLYRYVRNPMYVGVLLVIAGWALLFGAPGVLLYGSAVGCVFHLFVLLVEEPSLRRNFGEQYTEYCRVVNRWLPRRA